MDQSGAYYTFSLLNVIGKVVTPHIFAVFLTERQVVDIHEFIDKHVQKTCSRSF